MNTHKYTEESLRRKYNKCKIKYAAKFSRLSKLYFKDELVNAKPGDKGKGDDKYSVGGSPDKDSVETVSIISLDSLMDNACDEEQMNQKVDELEILIVREQDFFDKIIELLLRMHHPLKKQDNDNIMPLLQYKKKQLLLSLMKTIELQYKTFRAIKTSLEHCIDIENYKSIQNMTANTGEKFYRTRRCQEVAKRYNEAAEASNATKAWAEQVKDYEEMLIQYKDRSGSEQKNVKPIVNKQEDFENTVKVLCERTQPADVIVSKLLTNTMSKENYANLFPGTCNRRANPYKHDMKNCVDSLNAEDCLACGQHVCHKVEDFLKIPIPDLPKPTRK
ncbi:hypothetical protein M8J76_015741 [Diaphorina citri]|nr:hypothetical protein M8J75_008936 [Diaphorina citri]KAI5745945.1 hypothetical protein M8J76_015741 [Diaphorina citri]